MRPGVWALVLALAVPAAARAQDARAGQDVFGPCAACHGANGEGGKGGEYPRLATQPPAYTVAQLKAFQGRKRMNLPMYPYTEERELSEGDMKDVAAFLAQIVLPAKTPDFKETDSALDRLLAMEKVLVVPRVEGDVEKGKALFRKKCSGCHGVSGQGRKDFPRLVGQYPEYLRKQLAAFRKGERPHDEEEAGEGALKRLKEDDLTNLLAWLTEIQDQDPEPDPVGLNLEPVK